MATPWAQQSHLFRQGKLQQHSLDGDTLHVLGPAGIDVAFRVLEGFKGVMAPVLLQGRNQGQVSQNCFASGPGTQQELAQASWLPGCPREGAEWGGGGGIGSREGLQRGPSWMCAAAGRVYREEGTLAIRR